MSTTISKQRFGELVQKWNRPAQEVGEELRKRDILVEGAEDFAKTVPIESKRTTFMQKIFDGGTSVLQATGRALPQNILGPERQERREQLGEAASPFLSEVGFVAGGITGGPVGAVAGTALGEVAEIAIEKTKGKDIPLADIPKRVGKESAIALATELGFGVLGRIGSSLGKTKLARATIEFLEEKFPAKLANTILKPLGKEFEFGKNPGRAIIDENITAGSRKSLLKKVGSKKNEIGGDIERFITKASKGEAKKEIDMEPLIQGPLKEAMLGARKRGEETLFNSLVKLQEGLTQEFIEQGTKIVPSGAKKLVVTPFGTWKQKQELADGIRWTGEPFNKDLNQVKFKIFKNLQKALNNSVKGLKSLNTRYANIIGAENSLLRQLAITERQNLAGFSQTTLGGVVGIGELATGGSVTEAVTKGVAAGALLKVLGSTPTKTIAAQKIKGLPKLVQSAIKKLEPAERLALFEIIQSQTQEPTE